MEKYLKWHVKFCYSCYYLVSEGGERLEGPIGNSKRKTLLKITWAKIAFKNFQVSVRNKQKSEEVVKKYLEKDTMI